jgi:hypothetical protein
MTSCLSTWYLAYVVKESFRICRSDVGEESFHVIKESTNNENSPEKLSISQSSATIEQDLLGATLTMMYVDISRKFVNDVLIYKCNLPLIILVQQLVQLSFSTAVCKV